MVLLSLFSIIDCCLRFKRNKFFPCPDIFPSGPTPLFPLTFAPVKKCLLLVFASFALSAGAQEGGSWFLRSARAELSGSYFQDRSVPHFTFREYTANAAFGFGIVRRLEAGIRSQNVFAYSNRVPDERFFLLGGYAQYDFMKESRHRFYGELTYGVGDYCPCGEAEFERRRGHYAGGAFGVDFRLGSGGFFAGMALVVQKFISEPRGDGDFNYLRFGVSYMMGKNK